tara:strand:- start:5847 stop:6026 length:180 start_codon:yes stop_codon:yes gene_type:complete
MSNFEQLRIKLNFGLANAAEALGVTERTIRRWEKGDIKTPKYATDLLKYRLVYGFPPKV